MKELLIVPKKTQAGFDKIAISFYDSANDGHNIQFSEESVNRFSYQKYKYLRIANYAKPNKDFVRLL